MDSYLINSININYCHTTGQDILENLEPCTDCGNIPIPSFRSYKDKENTYCKSCYVKKNYEIELANPMSKAERNLLSKLRISCQYYGKGCSEVFRISTLKDLIEHENKCKYSELLLRENKQPIDETSHQCIECKNFHIDNNDITKSIIYQQEKIIKILSDQDSKITLLFNNMVERMDKMESIQTSHYKLNTELNDIILRNDKISQINVNAINEKLNVSNELIKYIEEELKQLITKINALQLTVKESNEVIETKILERNFKNQSEQIINQLYQDNVSIKDQINKIQRKIIPENIQIISNKRSSSNKDSIKQENNQIIAQNNPNLQQNIIQNISQIKPLNKKDYTNNNYFKLGEHGYIIYCIIEITDNKVATCSDDKFIKIWEINTKQCIKSISCFLSKVYSIIKLSNDLIASRSEDKIIRIWDINTGNCIKALTGHTKYIECMVKLSNGTLASGSNDSIIRIWDLINYQYLFQLIGHNNYVNSICELNDNRLASGSADNTIKIWKKDQLQHTLTGHSGTICSLIEISDDLIASGSSDNTIKIWKISNKECIFTLTGHIDTVRCIRLLSDGRLVSGSYDKSIKFWDLNSKECIQTLNRHNTCVNSVIELSDRRLVSVDNSILIWR